MHRCIISEEVPRKGLQNEFECQERNDGKAQKNNSKSCNFSQNFPILLNIGQFDGFHLNGTKEFDLERV